MATKHATGFLPRSGGIEDPLTEPYATRSPTVEVERSCARMAAKERREASMDEPVTGDDTTLNLAWIDDPDESAMPILPALKAEQANRGQHLHRMNTSPQPRQWFKVPGATAHLFPDQWNANE